MATATKTIRELDEEAKGLLLAAKAILDKGDDATPEDLEDATAKTAAAEEIGARLEKCRGGDALKSLNRLENTLAVLRQADRPASGHPGDGSSLMGDLERRRDGEAIKSLGEQFLESELFGHWLKMIAPNGNAPDTLPGASPAVAIKTLYTGAADRTAGGPLLGQPYRDPTIPRLGWPMLVLRQLVTEVPVNTDLVEVVRELSRTNAAANVAEATAATGTTGTKPESAIAFEVANVPVETIAHWIPATTRILSDANRLRAEIDQFLRDGIDQAVEAALLTGSGTSPAFRGVNNTVGILTQAYDATGQPLLTTTRKARTNLKVNGRVEPTAYVFHPNDWEDLDLLPDGEERYYFGGPIVMGTPRLWGVPVVESEFQTEGLALLGNWRDAVLYDREQTTIRIGTINDDFVRNLIRILAEARMAFNVRRPKSFVQIDLTAV